MIGMDFVSFLILLIISLVVSGVLHYGLSYYATPGHWSFLAKVGAGWLGAWIGSPVLGYWPHRWPVFHYQTIYIIPAILGALAVLVVAVDLAKIGRAHQ
jgi:uncharacterized membrane protein YeaQ/YmgE (transglycosylase-associated protein family)